MSKKKVLGKVIEDLAPFVKNDEFIADIVRELQEHHATLEDESAEDDGGNHPNRPPGKP